MRAQNLRRVALGGLHEERVVRLARRVTFREVQRGEIVPVVFHVRAFGHGEAHVTEDRGDLLEHLHHRVQCASLRAGHGRQGQVQRLGDELLLQRLGFQLGLAGLHGLIDAGLQRVQLRAVFLALFRAHLAQRPHQAGDPALLAQLCHAHSVQRLKVTCPGNRRERFVFDGHNIGQGLAPLLFLRAS